MDRNAPMTNIRYLARQAFPFRGERKTEGKSNFHQLLKQRAQENSEIIEWLRKRDDKYTLPETQSEMLEAMALGMMRHISANNENAKFFTIMADETADVCNQEQLLVCIKSIKYVKIKQISKINSVGERLFNDTQRFHWNASFGKNNCRSSSSNTKEYRTENEYKYPARPWAVL